MADIEPADLKPVAARGWIMVRGKRGSALLRISDVLLVTVGDDDLAVLHIRDGGRDNITVHLQMTIAEVTAAIAASEG